MRLTLAAAFAALAAPVMADVPRVVTDLPPVHALAAQVMGDLGVPVLLLDRGANAHSFQLRPSQARSLEEADLLIWIGPEMTPWLARSADAVAGRAATLALLDLPQSHRQDFGAAGAHDHGHDHASGHDKATHASAGDDHKHDHGHDQSHGHDHGSGHDKAAGDAGGHDHDHDHDHGHDEAGGHGHSHDGVDPHAWLDPANGGAWLGAIAETLATLDPANAATYRANAAAAQADLRALDARIAAVLAPHGDKPFVVFHDAYGYFSAHYGLTVAGSIALGDAAAPGAQRLREIRDTLVTGGVVCVFPEAQHDPGLVRTVVEGTGVRVGGTLDPSGSTLDAGPGLYATLLTGLAEGIADCLKG